MSYVQFVLTLLACSLKAFKANQIPKILYTRGIVSVIDIINKGLKIRRIWLSLKTLSSLFSGINPMSNYFKKKKLLKGNEDYTSSS